MATITTAISAEGRVIMKDGIHGKWEMTYNGMMKNVNTGFMMTVYHCKCSVCGWETGNQGTRFNYCPNCGEKMDKVNQPNGE